jgi:aldehyde dehydrogenase (NAD+)
LEDHDVTTLPRHEDLIAETSDILARLGVSLPTTGTFAARSPITGGELARVPEHTPDQVRDTIAAAAEAFATWRAVPAPVRGQFVRELGELLREHKSELGALVSIEAGKIRSEGLGEVQEMIDICDLAVGLSRQLFGLTIASERPGHRMMEQWHPLGVVGVISAFNFPVAVWSWNAALAFVCGDPVVWKPSEKTVLTALACQALAAEAARRVGAPAAVSSVVIGGPAIGEVLVDDPRVALLSATGSTRMGRAIAPRVAGRLGRLLLELGGNNAAIVGPSADLDLTVRGIVFAALPIGSPLAAGTLVGPLIDAAAYEGYRTALDKAEADGGEIVIGGERVLADEDAGAFYVQPALVRMPGQTDVVRSETFAPVLYVMTYDDFDQALALHNDVPQGLSSSIFTRDVLEAERFVSAGGSDCGIANVNIGPSGAEIGGAFGGEKETGGGRESGSDAWKSYMRRTTNTVNYSTELPLAQGVEFG